MKTLLMLQLMTQPQLMIHQALLVHNPTPLQAHIDPQVLHHPLPHLHLHQTALIIRCIILMRMETLRKDTLMRTVMRSMMTSNQLVK